MHSKRGKRGKGVDMLAMGLSVLGLLALAGGRAMLAEGAGAIRVAVPARSLSYLPFMLAVNQGFFREEGLEVKVLQIKTALIPPSLQAGGVDYATAFSGITNAAIAGIPVKNVMVLSDKINHVFLAKPGITSATDLKGKRFGINSFGDLTDNETRAFLHAFKVPPESVQFIVLGGGRMPALLAGSIDATVTPIPENFPVEARGFVRLGRAADYLPTPNAGWGTTVHRIREQRPEVKRTIRANVRGLRAVRTEKAAAIRIITDYMQVDPAVARQTYELVADNYPQDGLPTTELVRAQVDLVRARLGIKQEIPIDQVADQRLVPEVLAEMRP